MRNASFEYVSLNNSIKYLREKGLSLHNYTNSPDFLEAIHKGTNEASFQGISGPFSFDNTNNRIGLTYLQRSINESDENTIVTYDQISDSLTWNIEPSSIWSDGNIPKDDFIYKEHPTNPNVPLAVSIATVNSFGCLICIGFLAFNIIFRHKWSIRMSSPHVNSVILIGCLCMYVVVYVSTVEYLQRYEDGTKGSVCMAKTWLIATGYTLMFGGMFAKTYRVYIIFKNTTVKRKVVRKVSKCR
ncbi:hypothetical protein DPMN_127042 [Dreissena polymorpha]|uniref:G-protein coupled receptors family 3 profile domain-containing protein n=1 Tax=Dreissena polymorpha TaxID=45954 RepID=A0A9D4JW55_DREPO|nr:hypothetical protein DPMN_127042 [Dreissena polymorpha]